MKRASLVPCFLLLWILISSLSGCTNNTLIETPPEKSNISTTAPYWATMNGTFFTKDFDRAQEEIPFKIIVPNYFPSVETNTLLPDIRGPLRKTQLNGDVEIEIRYTLEPESENSGLIRMFETNKKLEFIDNDTNPNSVIITILNKKVLKKEQEDFGLGRGFWFGFSVNGISYIVEVYNIPFIEATKIVESIIIQLV